MYKYPRWPFTRTYAYGVSRVKGKTKRYHENAVSLILDFFFYLSVDVRKRLYTVRFGFWGFMTNYWMSSDFFFTRYLCFCNSFFFCE